MPAAASRWASQAALDALLRFNPQRQSLAEQIREAQQSYGSTVRAGRVTAQETERSSRRALPLLQAAYSKANAAQQAGATLVSQGLANLPAADSQYKANQLGTSQVTLDNLAKAGASAQAQMLERGTRAREGAQFNQLNAQQVLARTLQQLFSKGQSLSGEQGAFAQSEAEKLAHEAESVEQRETASERSAQSAAAGRQTTERGQNLSHAAAERGNDISAAKNKGAGTKVLTTAEHNSARNTIENVRREAYEIRNLGTDYNTTKGDLEHPLKLKTGTRKAYANNGLLKAGLDLAYFGGIGKGTLGLLHKEGYSLEKLGYPVYHAPPRTGGGFDAIAKAIRSTGKAVSGAARKA